MSKTAPRSNKLVILPLFNGPAVPRLPVLAGAFGLCLAGAVDADLLYLDDGSRLAGSIRTTDTDGIVIETAFAGELKIPMSRVSGVTTDGPLSVQLVSEDRVRGRLVYDAETGTQRLTDTAFGAVTLDPAMLAAVWPRGEPVPEVKQAEREFRTELAQVRSEHAKTVQTYTDKLAIYEDPWSGRVSMGLDAASGNSQRLQFRGRAEAKRVTDHDRLTLFAEGQMQEQQKVLTDKEIRLGAHVEHDISNRWFAFVRQDLEKDKFENLELRSETTGGIGYFVLREPEHEWKLRAGLGYQFESFENGVDMMQGILPLGWDYLVDVADWVRFTHALTVYPTFSDPTGNYRLDSNATLEVPLGASDAWKLQLSLRHEYDRMPVAGARSLDTTYGANIVLDID